MNQGNSTIESKDEDSNEEAFQNSSKAFSQEEENFYKVSHLVLDEIPSHLRQFFKQVWDARNPTRPWDDTLASRDLLLARENNKSTRIVIKDRMQHGDRNKWDVTALFSVLLFSSQKYLNQIPNAFSCIDRLRILRNAHFAHLESPKIINSHYQQIMSEARRVFTQMNWSVDGITAIESKAISVADETILADQLNEERTRHTDLERWMKTVENEVTQLRTDVTINQREIIERLNTSGNVFCPIVITMLLLKSHEIYTAKYLNGCIDAQTE